VCCLPSSGALAEAGVNIQTVSSGLDSVTFYVDSDDAAVTESLLHEQVIADDVLSSVTVDDGLAAVRVTGGEMAQQIGAIDDLLAALVDERVLAHDVVTSVTSVSVFVDWTERETALEALQAVV